MRQHTKPSTGNHHQETFDGIAIGRIRNIYRLRHEIITKTLTDEYGKIELENDQILVQRFARFRFETVEVMERQKRFSSVHEANF